MGQVRNLGEPTHGDVALSKQVQRYGLFSRSGKRPDELLEGGTPHFAHVSVVAALHQGPQDTFLGRRK